MTEALQLPALQVPAEQQQQGARDAGHAWSSSSTPTLRRRRFRMRRLARVHEPSLEAAPPSAKEFLQLPSIEITPSSDEDAPWSSCSTPSASPRRQRSLLRKWLTGREKQERGESSSWHWALDLLLGDWWSQRALQAKMKDKKNDGVNICTDCSQQSSQQSSHDDDACRFLSPRMRDDRHMVVSGAALFSGVLKSVFSTTRLKSLPCSFISAGCVG
ncbi:hypothetical protein lerEdw1_004458 [Lerista edwardsae]|nr:hypothetical protein lerEdw1_004458 [Lerista edwardsae]